MATKINFAAVIESANATIKVAGKELRNADKESRSISSVLKDMQRREFLKAGYAAVFDAIGIDAYAGKITPADFFSRVHSSLHGTDKKGQDYVGLWGMKKQEDGSSVPVLRKITAWTPRKVFMVLAQSIEAAK